MALPTININKCPAKGGIFSVEVEMKLLSIKSFAGAVVAADIMAQGI